MTKRKNLWIWYLCVSLVMIITAVVLSLTVGINIGTDIGGGTQVEIRIEDTTKVNAQTKAVKSALRKHGLVEESIFVEDRGVEDENVANYLVVRIGEKNIDASLRDALAEKLGIDVANVSELHTINGTVTNRTVIWAAVTIVCLLIAIFVAGWLRYKVMAGLTLMFAALYTIIMSASALIITRIPISFMSLIVVLASVLFTLFACVITLERLRENMKAKHNEGLSTDELVDMSSRSTLKPLIAFAILVAILALVFVVTPVSEVSCAGAAIFVCLAVSGLAYYFVILDVHKYLLEAKTIRDKIRLSHNPNIEAELKPAAKTRAKKAADKKKDKELVQRQKARTQKKDDGSAPVV